MKGASPFTVTPAPGRPGSPDKTSAAAAALAAFIGTATNDPSTGQPWLLDRGILKNFVLIGPAPVYGPGVPIQTVPGHFQAWVQ